MDTSAVNQKYLAHSERGTGHQFLARQHMPWGQGGSSRFALTAGQSISFSLGALEKPVFLVITSDHKYLAPKMVVLELLLVLGRAYRCLLEHPCSSCVHCECLHHYLCWTTPKSAFDECAIPG